MSGSSRFVSIFIRVIFGANSVFGASVLLIPLILAIIASVIAVCTIENLPLSDVTFEVVSAAATVGLTTGITSTLSPVSHIILMLLMYGGRLGGLTLMIAFAQKEEIPNLVRPAEKIQIG